MVALDHDQFRMAKLLARSGHNIGFKVNLDFLLEWGPVVVGRRLKEYGRPLFADVKMWNGRRTMMAVMELLAEAGFDYANVHILAGPETPQKNYGFPFKLLGVALLTHYDEHYGHEYFDRSTTSQIIKLINRANAMPALDGVIAGARFLPNVWEGKLRVCPGVRPSWYGDDRHSNPITPAEAIKFGADILVIGSPITKSDNPVIALDRIFEEIS
jgi:orotidine-5'-phosphate decarboxylase